MCLILSDIFFLSEKQFLNTYYIIYPCVENTRGGGGGGLLNTGGDDIIRR